LENEVSKVLKEISTTVGEYKNAAGETKKRYLRIGSIIETKSGPMLKIDSIPLKEGGWDGWAYINDPKKPDDAPQPKKSSGFDDLEDLPF
jgi:hypothetical protein